MCKKNTCDTVPGTMVDKWIDVDHDSDEVRFFCVFSACIFLYDSAVSFCVHIMSNHLVCTNVIFVLGLQAAYGVVSYARSIVSCATCSSSRGRLLLSSHDASRPRHQCREEVFTMRFNSTSVCTIIDASSVVLLAVPNVLSRMYQLRYLSVVLW